MKYRIITTSDAYRVECKLFWGASWSRWPSRYQRMYYATPDEALEAVQKYHRDVARCGHVVQEFEA